MRLQESLNMGLSKTFVRFLYVLKKQIVKVKITVRCWSIVLAIRQVIIENIGVFATVVSAIRRLYATRMVCCKQ